ncbi:MAG: hypothetical protein QXR57_05510 [Metallosphaera sp.]|uniref:Uncharacterized protein n=2 Tax=Metallosphaera TaxID=41980 RepID=F4G296_METCR|nr:hypothetical protein [Metallosphaera cuprina]AEB94944.1 hypothetical protein Mcup_0839 [Metallosphaera cuprina Ar-4]
MKTVKYEVTGRIEDNGKTTTLKRKYRHLKNAREFVRALLGREVNWSEEKEKIVAEYKSQGISYRFEIVKQRIERPKSETKGGKGKEKTEAKPKEEEKKTNETEKAEQGKN